MSPRSINVECGIAVAGAADDGIGADVQQNLRGGRVTSVSCTIQWSGANFAERILVHLCDRRSNHHLSVSMRSINVECGTAVAGAADDGIGAGVQQNLRGGRLTSGCLHQQCATTFGQSVLVRFCEQKSNHRLVVPTRSSEVERGKAVFGAVNTGIGAGDQQSL